jgi:hypothetical protein
MGTDNPQFERHAQLAQRVRRALHRLEIGFGTHDDANQRAFRNIHGRNVNPTRTKLEPQTSDRSFTIPELAAILLRLKARRGCWIVFSVGARETGFLEIC